MPERTTTLDLEELRVLLAEMLQVDISELTDTADFAENFDVDSLTALEVVVKLERKYHVKFEDESLQKIRSLRDTYDLLAAKLQQP